MKIGIVSDTHDHVDVFGKVGTFFKEKNVGMIIHCGDWCSPFAVALFTKVMNKMCPAIPIEGVFGNNDGDIYHTIQLVETEELAVAIQKDILEIEQDGKKIVVYHGTEEAIVQALLKSGSYDAVFRGHTHVANVETIGKTLHVNPGTVSGYSNGTILQNVSVAIYDSANNTAELIFFPR